MNASRGRGRSQRLGSVPASFVRRPRRRPQKARRARK